MKRLAVILVLIVLASTAYAQRPKKAVKAYEAAEEAFMKRDYQKAHQQALKAVLEDPNYAEAWLLEGEIGMETQNYDLATLGFENALSSDSLLFPPAAITLARIYDRRGAYKREVALLRWYQSKHFGNVINDATVAEMLELAAFRDYAITHPVAFVPESLGTMVNTKDEEYVNMLSFDGSQLLFTRKMLLSNGFQKEFLFVSQWDGEQWTEPQQLAFSDFPEDVDPAAAFISADGKKLYLTGCGWKRDSSCDLYVSEMVDGRWSMPQAIKGSVNTNSWESQPCVSSDGRELYFVSRRNGNADIYRSLRHSDGTWSEPQNLNTSGDEINFFVAADGKTAFVSSQREGGNGGYDIYTFELPEELRSDSANYLATVDVVELAPGDAVVLQNIQFEYNSSALTDDSQAGIEMLVEFLKRNPDLKVELAGHTDDVGSASYNQKLSADRAESVRKALISNGIDETRLTAKGYGATKPLAPNDSEEHRALNRRTEMIIID